VMNSLSLLCSTNSSLFPIAPPAELQGALQGV
jgi:hypothetical protein